VDNHSATNGCETEAPWTESTAATAIVLMSGGPPGAADCACRFLYPSIPWSPNGCDPGPHHAVCPACALAMARIASTQPGFVWVATKRRTLPLSDDAVNSPSAYAPVPDGHLHRNPQPPQTGRCAPSGHRVQRLEWTFADQSGELRRPLPPLNVSGVRNAPQAHGWSTPRKYEPLMRMSPYSTTMSRRDSPPSTRTLSRRLAQELARRNFLYAH